MRIERIGLFTEGIRTKVFDVDKKELIGVFESRNDAAKFTGLPLGHIKNYVSRKSKHYSKKLNRKITFR